MPFYVYADHPRQYPYPPLARWMHRGDVVELEPDQVPTDGRFRPAEPADLVGVATAPAAVDELPATAKKPTPPIAKASRAAAKPAKE